VRNAFCQEVKVGVFAISLRSFSLSSLWAKIEWAKKMIKSSRMQIGNWVFIAQLIFGLHKLTHSTGKMAKF